MEMQRHGDMQLEVRCPQRLKWGRWVLGGQRKARGPRNRNEKKKLNRDRDREKKGETQREALGKG